MTIAIATDVCLGKKRWNFCIFFTWR